MASVALKSDADRPQLIELLTKLHSVTGPGDSLGRFVDMQQDTEAVPSRWPVFATHRAAAHRLSPYFSSYCTTFHQSG